MKPYLKTTAIAVVAFGLVAWALRTQLDPTREPNARRVEAANGSIQDAPTASSLVSVDKYLGAYFGPRWKPIRAQLVEAGRDLDAEIDPGAIPEWDVVHATIHDGDVVLPGDARRHLNDALAWDEERWTQEFQFQSPDCNPRARPLGPEDRAQLLTLVGPYDLQLEALANHAVLLFDEAMHRLWEEGRYERSPLVSATTDPQKGHAVRVIRYFVRDNWHIVITLREGDAPEYDRVLAEIRTLREQRLETARNYIRRLT